MIAALPRRADRPGDRHHARRAPHTRHTAHLGLWLAECRVDLAITAALIAAIWLWVLLA